LIEYGPRIAVTLFENRKATTTFVPTTPDGREPHCRDGAGHVRTRC
jgi:hypothetical protein